MMRLTAVGLVLVLSAWTPLAGQGQKERCGTRQPSDEEELQIEQRISRVRGRAARAEQTVQVWVHVITRGAGFENGELSDQRIRSQIQVLEDAFGGRTGGAGTGFGFELAGVTRTNNARWFEQLVTDLDVELEAKQALRQGGADALNIYTVDGGPYLGFAYFPSILTSSTTPSSMASCSTGARCRVGRLQSTVKATPARTKWATGSRSTTRSRGSAAARTTTSRTRPRSSRPRSTARWGVTAAPSLRNRASIPIYNFMDYTQDSCMFMFTPGQVERMQAAWTAYRAP